MKYGEIWLVNFSPNVGAEIGKIRVAVIVSNDVVGVLPLKVVVPITEPLKKIQNWHLPLVPNKVNGLDKKCVADCFQVKSVSKERFVRKIGELNEDEIAALKVKLVIVLDLI